MTPAVSVILCTHDRSAFLGGAIEALLGQEPGSPPYEVVVVDNASTDGTRDLLREAVRRRPDVVRVVREERLGLAHARNAGIAAARAPLLAFTDDDVRVDPRWIQTIVSTFAAHPEAGWIGGPVRPLEPIALGDWTPLGLQDHGRGAFAVGAGRPLCLIGANLAVRAAIVAAHGGFDPAFQRIGDGIGSTEDHAFQERLWRRGLTGRYDTSLTVEAIVEPRRLSARYRRRWHFGHGRFVARMQVPEAEAYGGRRLFGVPAHLVRTALDSLLHARSGDAWFAAGFIRERFAGRPVPVEERGLTSIVIPSFNQASFLEDAIHSALAQHDVEVIVVDDESTDGSAAVAARFANVRLLRQRRGGVAAARNTGLHASRGDCVLFLDADDRLRDGAIAALRAALEQEPRARFAYGRFNVIDADGHVVPAEPPRRDAGDDYEALLRSNFICAPAAVLYRRAPLVKAGGFSRGIDPAADYDANLRLAAGGAVVAANAVVADYRSHGGGMSRRADRMLRATLRAHARQRAMLTTDARRRAWADGRAFWRAFYGTQLVDQARRAWRDRSLARLVRDLALLARYAPAVLAAHAARKVRLMVSTQRTRYSTNRPSS